MVSEIWWEQADISVECLLNTLYKETDFNGGNEDTEHIRWIEVQDAGDLQPTNNAKDPPDSSGSSHFTSCGECGYTCKLWVQFLWFYWLLCYKSFIFLPPWGQCTYDLLAFNGFKKAYILSFYTILLPNSLKCSYPSFHRPTLCARIYPLVCFPVYFFFSSTAPGRWMILSKRLSFQTPTGQCRQTMYLAVFLALWSTVTLQFSQRGADAACVTAPPLSLLAVGR